MEYLIMSLKLRLLTVLQMCQHILRYSAPYLIVLLFSQFVPITSMAALSIKHIDVLFLAFKHFTLLYGLVHIGGFCYKEFTFRAKAFLRAENSGILETGQQFFNYMVLPTRLRFKKNDISHLSFLSYMLFAAWCLTEISPSFYALTNITNPTTVFLLPAMFYIAAGIKGYTDKILESSGMTMKVAVSIEHMLYLIVTSMLLAQYVTGSSLVVVSMIYSVMTSTRIESFRWNSNINRRCESTYDRAYNCLI